MADFPDPSEHLNTLLLKKLKTHVLDRLNYKVAAFINPYVRGWTNYYGACYKEPLREILNHVNALLVIWAKRKFKSFNRSRWKARKWLKAIAKRDPNLFAMWSMNVRP